MSLVLSRFSGQGVTVFDRTQSVKKPIFEIAVSGINTSDETARIKVGSDERVYHRDIDETFYLDSQGNFRDTVQKSVLALSVNQLNFGQHSAIHLVLNASREYLILRNELLEKSLRRP